MPETSHQFKPRIRTHTEINITSKSSIFDRRDFQLHNDKDERQSKNQSVHPLSGSNFSLPTNPREVFNSKGTQNYTNSTKQMFSSTMFGMDYKGNTGSLFHMARHVHDPVDQEEFKAEKERNKYSFLQANRSNVSEGTQDDAKRLDASIFYQRKEFKAPSFLKKDAKSPLGQNQNTLENTYKKHQNKSNASPQNQNETTSQVGSIKSKKVQFSGSQNYSPMLLKKGFDSISPVNSSESKNISTNEPKQSTLSNTLLDPNTISRNTQRKDSMKHQNQKQYYTPTQRNSKLGASEFYEIAEKSNTVKYQNKSQFLMIHQREKHMPSLSPRVNQKKQKSTIPSFIKFKERRNQILQKQQDLNPYSIINTSTSLDICEPKISLQDFQIKQRLGRGAFGDVYLARQKNIGFVCVLKKLSKKKIKQQNTQQLIMREIKIQTYLTHRHITSLFGFFDDDEHIYLVIEYMSDGSVAQRYGRRKMSEKKVASIVKQTCQALKYMHIESIIHRDIKPENIFIHEDYVKLGDFGCSVFSDTKRNTMLGSLAYFSPEQLNKESYDEKIDVWSVGVLCYELLTGRSPFQEDILKIARQEKDAKLSELRFPSKIELSEEAKDFTRKLLQELPQNRLTICETLKHPFIVKNTSPDNMTSSTQMCTK